jgi:hypothetical protein
MYLGVHLYYLGGAPGHRLKVLIDWVAARLGYRQNQVIEGELRQALAERRGSAKDANNARVNVEAGR